jgi:hypothetical protein
LIEIAHDDRVIWKIREKFPAHLPPPPLLVLPSHDFLASFARLRMITTEKRVTAEDNIFRVDPVFRLIGFLVPKDAFDANIVPQWPQC